MLRVEDEFAAWWNNINRLNNQTAFQRVFRLIICDIDMFVDDENTFQNALTADETEAST